jgi:hypothetical protein
MYNAGVPVQPFRLPNMRTLGANIERLGLDVARHVTLHGQTSTHEEFLQAIAD